MSSPYEEIEFLAQCLPDDGESVLVSRRDGELVCEAWPQDSELLAEGIFDPVLYGRLVQANERLVALGSRPLWTCGLIAVWGCILLHRITGDSWQSLLLDCGLFLSAVAVCFVWIRERQRRAFRLEIRPVLDRWLAERGYDRFAVLGAVRQHPELRTLLDELAR